jgi:hypothetical protein
MGENEVAKVRCARVVGVGYVLMHEVMHWAPETVPDGDVS